MFRFLSISALLVCCLAAQQPAPPQGFLQLDSIKGDSTDVNHPNEIVILGLSYDIRTDTTASASGRSAATPTGADRITLFKRFDMASPKLVEDCFTGKHIQDATLTLARAGSDIPLAEVNFKELQIIAVDIEQPANAASGPTELLTMQFGSVEWCYFNVNAAGGLAGKVCSKINIVQGRVASLPIPGVGQLALAR